METGLIAALGQAAKKARESSGASRAEIAAKVGKTEDTIRLFENGGTFTALNDLLSAYEETTDSSLQDLLDQVRLILNKNG